MRRPSALYLIYNDEEGSFVSVKNILSVNQVKNDEGSAIRLKDGSILYSPLKPRQLLHKIRIIRHKLKLEDDNESRRRRDGAPAVPTEPEPPDEMGGGSKNSS